tara:strand:+ start:3331 stop:4059 length:729 start_codon:yes stop_codon:yes gene_type:complete
MNCHCCKGQYQSVYENTFRCVKCKHIYRAYKGDEVDYHKNQYRNIERRDVSEIDSEGKIQPLFHEKRKTICEKRINFVSQYIQTNDSYLDIGAGAGTYINLLRDHVATIECTELDASLITECERLGFQVHKESFLQLEFKNNYDIVSAWHVLEHVEDIDSFLKKCSEITNKYCIIEIPLLRSLSGTGRVRKLVDPQDGVYDGHAHYFTKESFVSIADKYFDVVEIREGVQSPALFAVMEPKT